MEVTKLDPLILSCLKGGLESFYQDLVSILKYPGMARRTGKEGRVYVQFIVDEQGNLTEFKPLTNEGYNFEEKAVKRAQEASALECCCSP